MPKINFRITLSKSDWQKIESAIEEKNARKKVKVWHHGRGYNHFITTEIHRVFKDLHIDDCGGGKIGRIQKTFALNISDENSEKISLLAKKMSITPSALICRMILDPHLVLCKEKGSGI